MLVLAGAGSGKTRVVTYRIVHLLELGVPASEILAVTFTNKAAEEMRERIQKLAHAHVLTCTFHSLCARILRESIDKLGYSKDFIIYDADDSEKCLKDCFQTLGHKDEKGALKNVQVAISRAKNDLIEPEDAPDLDQLTKSIYLLYQTRLKSYNALDFDDLLFLSVKLFRQHPDVLELFQKRWSFILIDEYQDTNIAQYILIKLLSQKHLNVFAVGDPDQSIYSWRGANLTHILNFERDFPGAQVVRLEQNYRSRTTILDAANALISHNVSREEKKLWSELGEGEKIGLYICNHEQQEASFVVQRIMKHHRLNQIPLSECAIFYRTNFQSRSFEDALLRERIPYIIVGGISFYQRREIKDILALLRLIGGSSDFLSFARTINLPKRGLGETTLAKLRSFAEEVDRDIITVCAAVVEGQAAVKLSAKQHEGLKHYLQVLFDLRKKAEEAYPLHQLIEEAIQKFNYLEHLKEDPVSLEERRGNLEEIVSKAASWADEVEYPSLSAFLEELSLKSSLDEKDLTQDAVRLMTLHHGKGLEFSAVFLVGMEEDLFPHVNAKQSSEKLEEERRLCYVGMTRAKEHLYFTASRERFLWGVSRLMRPSRFLREIPEEILQAYHATATVAQQETSESGEEEPFSTGDTVLHKDFGPGVIQKSYVTSLGMTYDVFFPRVDRTRSLVAKYAKLSKIE
jgi:DNA helicase-2/ATP-dependent DNA helicase PcrA